MNDILLVIAGIAAGTYFAEEIRKVAPILDKKEGA